MTDHANLPNGVEAKMFAGKSSYPASAPVDVHLELLTPEGGPFAGRADLSLVAFDSFSGDPERLNLNFAERHDEPGVYDATIQAPKTWKRVTVLLTLNEWGSPADPGENERLELQIDHSAPAHVLSVTDAMLSENGAEVVVGVATDRPGRAAVRAELRDGEGQSFGDAFGVSYLAPGQGNVTLAFPALRAAHASASHAFYLADLTLFIDETTADFRRDPLPIDLRSGAALARK